MKKIVLMIMAALMCISSTCPVMAEEGLSVETAKSGQVVIVLDPGHDSTHGGAYGNGLSEEVLNLKIAKYCMEELNTYNNVKVYLTRESESCPYPGGNAGNDNLKRVQFAQSVGADAYVSLHLNALDNASYGGVEVFYPNQNYRPELSTIGAELSRAVLNELVGLGLENRGIKIRNAEVSKYADGSVGDYYQIIREAKNRNITGIIVEHAYISCSHDASNFLSTEAKLKALGVADATGIAKYYGLSKSGENDANEPEPVTTHTVTFVCNGETVSTQTVEHGQAAKEPNVDKEGMYTIYDREFSCITADTVVQISYEPIPAPEPEEESEEPTETESGTEADSELVPEETETREPTEVVTPDTETEGTEVSEPVFEEGVSIQEGVSIVITAACIVGIVIVIVVMNREQLWALIKSMKKE